MAASRSSDASGRSYAGPLRMLTLTGRSPVIESRSSSRIGPSIRAPRGKTRIVPLASRMRNPIARSSSNTGRSSPASTRDRYQTHSRSWSGEVSVTSAGSIVPVRRTSPAARLEMRDVDVSPTRIADR